MAWPCGDRGRVCDHQIQEVREPGPRRPFRRACSSSAADPQHPGQGALLVTFGGCIAGWLEIQHGANLRILSNPRPRMPGMSSATKVRCKGRWCMNLNAAFETRAPPTRSPLSESVPAINCGRCLPARGASQKRGFQETGFTKAGLASKFSPSASRIPRRRARATTVAAQWQ